MRREVLLEHLQHRRRVERGRRVVERVERAPRAAERHLLLLAVYARDPGRLAGEELRGEVPERRDERRLDQLDLAKEMRLAGRDLLRHAGRGSPAACTSGRSRRRRRRASSPIPASSVSSSFPACPTNGTPCWSSWNPGASPTNIRSAFGSPEPKTTCVRPCRERATRAARGLLRVRSSAAARSTASIGRSVYGARMRRAADSEGSVAAAAGAAAAAATAARGPLKLGFDAAPCDGEAWRAASARCRRRTRGSRRPAPRADELVEVGLALHARVLVDRHRAECTVAGGGTGRPDARGRHRPARAAEARARGRALGGLARSADMAWLSVVQPQTRDEYDAWLGAGARAATAGRELPLVTIRARARSSARRASSRYDPSIARVEIGWTWLHPRPGAPARTSRRSCSAAARLRGVGLPPRRAEDGRAERALARRNRGARRDVRGDPPQAHARPRRREPRHRLVQRPDDDWPACGRDSRRACASG